MNRFAFKTPRTILAVAALALSVLTLAASIAPARLEAGAPGAYAAVNNSAATEVAIIPGRIDVVAEREPRTLFSAVRQLFVRKGQPS